MSNTPTLTPESQNLFNQFVESSWDWDGTPMLDITSQQRGNLTQLKVAGLITTFEHDGIDFVKFTPAGYEYAASLGLEICKG